MKYEISCSVKPGIDRKTIEKILKAFSRSTGQSGNPEVSIVFVGETAMKRMNAAYRGKNKPTDVLSFAYENEGGEMKNAKSILGEIVICAPKAAKQAKRAGHSLKKELSLLLAHGLLHLVGYDHSSDAEEEEMKEMERKILNKI